MNNILCVKNLTKKYHTNKKEILSVDNFSMTLKEGEFIGIVGPSGCGKSTILSILSGLEESTSGKIELGDNKIGYMLQTDALFDWLTILDNCLIGLKIQGDLTKNKINYVMNLLDKYGLKEFINSYPNHLSGGMRQRVALIRTLAIKPDILLMDEPYSALDYQTRLAISDDVFKILKEENKSMVMVTHDIAEAISMCDRVIVLSKRPCTIKKIFNLELTDKSTPIENRKTKEFADYYDKIWKEIDYEL
jgi:ABC-type nitrate/sulfonate/bicarbonate transport system, ATPase component